MKQSTSTDRKKGRKRCLDRFPYHLCHPGWRAERGAPTLVVPKHQGGSSARPWGWGNGFTGRTRTGLISKKLPWSWWDTTTPGLCSVPSQVPFTARTPGEAEEHSPRQNPRQPRSSFPPPRRPAQPSTTTRALYEALKIPFWVCPHARCCTRLDTAGFCVCTGKKIAIDSNRARISHIQSRANYVNFLLQEFSADSHELLQKPEQTPGRLIDLQPWLPPDISSDRFYFLPCRWAPPPRSSPARRKTFRLPRLRGSAAVCCRSGQRRKERVKLEPENNTGIRPPSRLYLWPFASSSRLGI